MPMNSALARRAAEPLHLLHPIVDTLFGQPCLAVHVQPHLTPEAQGALRSLQDAAAERWPSRLHLAPAHAFHVTVYPLVPTSEGFDKEAYWGRIAEEARALVREICAGHPPVVLNFRALKVMPVGIIAVAEENGTGLIERLRRGFVETLPPPPGLAHRQYDLIHTTLARFAATEQVPATAIEGVEALPVSLTAPVERIKIFRETVFPCIVGEELASVRLA